MGLRTIFNVNLPQESSTMARSLSRRRRHQITQLRRKRKRDKLGQMIVEGVRGVESAVAASAPLLEIIVTSSAASSPRVQRVLQQASAPVFTVDEAEMAELAPAETSQGIVAIAETRVADLAELTASERILILDGVQDPGNVGTMIRTAAWFGIGAVVSTRGTAGFFGPKVVRAAAGSLWDVQLATVSDAGPALDYLRIKGFSFYGADLQGTPAQHWRPGTPSVLVMGSEAHGLSPRVLDFLDERVSIPGAAGREGAESLNVGVAAGILLFKWCG